jgi:DNA-binding transcriptional ArsR family regulator
MLFRRVRRWWGRSWGAGLYARLEGRALLKHQAREAVMDLLRRRPGLAFVDIQQAIGLAPGTTKWHLDKLSRSAFIASRRDGRTVRYYPRGMDPTVVDAVISMRDPSRCAIVRVAMRAPGVTQGDLAATLGLAQSTVSHHAARLVEEGVLLAERDGKTVTYSVNGARRRAVEDALAFTM